MPPTKARDQRTHASVLGNIVPADVTLVEGEYLSIHQSALTGESLPVDKAVGDIVDSSSIAKTGEMRAVVTATGVDSLVIAAEAKPDSGNWVHSLRAG